MDEFPNIDRTLLVASGLSVSLGGRSILRKFDFELADGEIVAVTGPSGCGKSTLLRALSGLTPVEPGCELLLHGKSPEAIGWTAYRRQVLYVHQKPSFYAGTAEDAIMRPFGFRANLSSGSAYNPECATDLLRRLLLDAKEILKQDIETLSVGQQQRVALVRALMLQPAVLLLDEPTSALDMSATQAVEALLAETCKKRGVGIAVVTHDEAQARNVCHRRVGIVPVSDS